MAAGRACTLIFILHSLQVSSLQISINFPCCGLSHCLSVWRSGAHFIFSFNFKCIYDLYSISDGQSTEFGILLSREGKMGGTIKKNKTHCNPQVEFLWIIGMSKAWRNGDNADLTKTKSETFSISLCYRNGVPRMVCQCQRTSEEGDKELKSRKHLRLFNWLRGSRGI